MPNTSKLEELKKDLEELQGLESQVTRKRWQDLLSSEAQKIKNEIKLLENVDASVHKEPKEAKLYTVILRNYSWDQSDKYLKLYITLPNVHDLNKDNVISSYTDRSFKLLVKELDGKNHELNIRNLAESINPESSYHKVKKDMVIVFICKKKESKWEVVTAEEKRAKEVQKSKYDSNKSDPSAGLMDLMQEMYNEGDDQMKQMIKKTWYENQLKMTSGTEDEK